MEKVIISGCRHIKLNSFRPLCINEYGKQAIQKYGFHPFIDSSCRREPDFENESPSITALCRQGIFAPHLRKGDVIVYITVNGKYPPYGYRHHRLVAILKVENIYDTHEEGRAGYLKLNNTVPSNCMAGDNPPYNYDQTAGRYKNLKDINGFLRRTEEEQIKLGSKLLRLWDNEYLSKSRIWTQFIQTKKIYADLDNPLPVFRKDFESVFNRLPNTRTPVNITGDQLIEIGKRIGIEIIIS